MVRETVTLPHITPMSEKPPIGAQVLILCGGLYLTAQMTVDGFDFGDGAEPDDEPEADGYWILPEP